MAKKKDEMQSPDPDLATRIFGRAVSFSFEKNWGRWCGNTPDTYDPTYPQKLVDFFVEPVTNQVNNPMFPIAPPYFSQFARSIGVSTKKLWEWEVLFPEFKAACEMAREIHKEIILSGGLLGKYKDSIAKLILSYDHSMHDKQEQINTNVNLIPMTAAESINFLLQQHGQPPIALPAVEEAEFTEIKVEKPKPSPKKKK